MYLLVIVHCEHPVALFSTPKQCAGETAIRLRKGRPVAYVGRYGVYHNPPHRTADHTRDGAQGRLSVAWQPNREALVGAGLFTRP